MRGLIISLLTLACLPHIVEAESEDRHFPGPRHQSSFYSGLAGPESLSKQCAGSKLSLDCGMRPYRWIEFKSADQRYQQNAFTIRFGNSNQNSPSKIEVQVGNFLSKALFIAAVVVTFLL